MKIEATPQNMRRIIGSTIRAVRNGRGLKQGELAKQAGVGVMTISNIEKPNYDGHVKVESYDKICSYLGIEFTIRGGAIKE